MPSGNSPKTKFYKKNESIPTASTQYVWTEEMSIELARCTEDIIHFAENYFYIVNMDKGKMKITLYNFQKNLLQTAVSNNRLVVLASRQVGKALGINELVPTPTGWTKMGDLKRGDRVFDENGVVCRVVHVHPIETLDKTYKVIFDNGDSLITSGVHEWYTETPSERGGRRSKSTVGSVKTTEEIKESLYRSGSNEPNHRIPRHNGIKLPDRNLTVDPYLLGYWLGDGTSATGQITVGKRDIEAVQETFNHPRYTGQYKINCRIRGNGSYCVSFNRLESEGLTEQLRALNVLRNKHIPSEYLRASHHQRLELLGGLMDSDGYVNPRGWCVYTTTDEQLRDGVCELVTSLGYKITQRSRSPKVNNSPLNIKGNPYRKAYEICFKPHHKICKTPYKANRLTKVAQSSRGQYHYIKDVIEIPNEPVRCITVDSSSSLFLAGKSMIPTHNSTLFTIYALWMACFNKDKRIILLANKEKTAIQLFSRIRMAYEMLPNWLKPGIDGAYGQTEMKLATGSSIMVAATSSTAIRGDSANVIILDEFAFVENNIVEEFWESVMPVISSSKTASVFIVSCVAGDTYVYTKKGLRQVKDFVQADKQKGYKVPDYSVFGRLQENQGSIMFNNGRAETRILQTTSGELECSLEHKLWACKDGKYGWHKAGDLKEGDFLSIQYGLEQWGNYDDTSDFTPRTSNKMRNLFAPRIITPEIAYFLGLYIAEGCVYREYKENVLVKGITTISCGDDVSSFIEAIGLPVCKTNGRVTHSISSTQLVEFLEYLGFDLSLKAPSKIIPNRLLQMSRSNMVAMLQGIYDGDGYCAKKNGRVGLTTTSRELAKQVRVILNNFGILTDIQTWITEPTKKVKVSSKAFRINCNAKHSRLFLEKIGFRLKRKQNNLAVLKNTYRNNDVVPFSKSLVREGLIKRGNKQKILDSKMSTAFFYIKGEHVSRDSLLKIREIFDDTELSCDLCAFLDQNCHSQIKWEPITSIITSENEVFDFSLNDLSGDPWCHSVVYNGFIGHQTPNGTQNKFYELYTAAERRDAGVAWRNFRVDWWQVPGRDEEWKKQMISDLGSEEAFAQEFGNQFIQTGKCPIDKDLVDILRSQCFEPAYGFAESIAGFEPQERIGLNTVYRIWELPADNRVYTIGVDVSEGIGRAASVAQVFDITDLTDIRQVAVYHNRYADPLQFANRLYQIARQYGCPPLLVERNNSGTQVINTLWTTYGYHRLVSYNALKNTAGVQSMGVYSHTNCKYDGIMNWRYWMNFLRVVTLRDIATLQEIETFERKPNGTWSAVSGEYIHDDRVMALVWALFLLHTPITQQYLNVLECDDQGKPRKVVDDNLLPIDPKALSAPIITTHTATPAFHMGVIGNNKDMEMAEMLQGGWRPL